METIRTEVNKCKSACHGVANISEDLEKGMR